MKRFIISFTAVLLGMITHLRATPNYLTDSNRPKRLGDLEVSLSLGYDSHYQFNGETFGRDVLWSSVDASLPVASGWWLGMNATYWDITSAVDGFEREFDLSFALTKELTPNTWLSLVATRYSYLGDFSDEPELGVELEHTWKRIDFSLWYGRGFEESGHYAEANISRAFHVNELISIVPSVQVGFASGYEDLGSGLTHFGFRIDFPLDFTDNISLVPYVAANVPLGALRSVDLTDETFYAGIALRCRF